ncbi:MAG: hypothetical protein AABW59_03910 [archaeon]
MKILDSFSVLREKKAQAALTDSIFFLAIVATLCTSLFYFAINYGTQMESQLNSFYSSDFANDSLKVINYVNVMRNGNSIFSELGRGETAEYDYLLALIKEDYSDDQEISPETRDSIAYTLHSVLRPFDDSVDYTYYLLSESEDKFLFLLMAVHECDGDKEECLNPSNADKKINRNYYYCEPSNKNVLTKKVYPYIGKVDSAVGKITLLQRVSAEKTDSKIFIMGLDVWISTDLEVLGQLDEKTLTPDFNCSYLDIDLE